MRVLIATEQTADQRKTLAAVRSLGDRGAVVTVGSDRFPCTPARSRLCAQRLRYPSPVDERAAFAATLRSELARGRYDVLLPLSDYTTIAAVAAQDELRGQIGIAVPPRAGFEIALDKLATRDQALRLGIAVPRTWCIADEDILEQVCREVDFPCVFKLRRGAGAVGLHFPASAAALRECYAAREVTSDPLYDSRRPLVQERVPGPVHDACLLFDRGRVRAAFTQERIAMFPAAGGVGIHNRSTDRPDLLAQAVALLASLDWHGPAMVEFKLDRRDGRFRLLEINPRFWGTLGLAIAAGVDFPWLTCGLARGTVPDSPPTWRSGLEHRWLIPYAFRHAREGRWRDLWPLLRPGRDRVSEWRWSDPLPQLADLFGAAG